MYYSCRLNTTNDIFKRLLKVNPARLKLGAFLFYMFMKNFFKQLFCKHKFVRFYQSIDSNILHENIWYYDDWQIDKCSKCGKQKNVNN